jgi:hypothetical protein
MIYFSIGQKVRSGPWIKWKSGGKEGGGSVAKIFVPK